MGNRHSTRISELHVGAHPRPRPIVSEPEARGESRYGFARRFIVIGRECCRTANAPSQMSAVNVGLFGRSGPNAVTSPFLGELCDP